MVIPKKLKLIIHFLRIQKEKCYEYGAGAAWSRLFFAWSRSRSRPSVVEAGVGSGTSDFRSRSRPKKWRLRNTVKRFHTPLPPKKIFFAVLLVT